MTHVVDHWRTRIVGYGEADPRDLVPNASNWRRHPEHQRAALNGILSEIGWVAEILVNRRSGQVIDGHLRLEEALARGEPRVPVRYVDLSLSEEKQVLASLDPITTMAQTDHDKLDALLHDVHSDNAQVNVFLNEMREQTNAQMASLAAEHELTTVRGRRPNRRRLPIDAYFTYSATDAEAYIAVRSGFGLGIQSNNVRLREDIHWVQPPSFVDCDYKHYQHEHHLGLVEWLRPKYATVRDVMTRQQCEAEGIEYVPSSQILLWADDLSQYAQNVIVTPKYDCLSEIPERYVLGYSATSSFGATAMPIRQFAGRRIHLLGGNWRDQLGYLALMGEDIVSLHLNLAARGAMFGTYYLKDGNSAAVSDLPVEVNNGYLVAMVLSLGSIGQALYEMVEGQRPRVELVRNEPEPW
jgi:hypothetical protein